VTAFDEDAADLVGVGMVSSTDARVWLRSRYPGRHILSVWPEAASFVHASRVGFDVGGDDPDADNTHAVEYPHRFAGAPRLEPSTRYRFRVTRDSDDTHVGEGGFETAPASIGSAPDRFAIAVMSCHQPFDDAGEYEPTGLRMLQCLESAFEQYSVKRILFIGDQMYADYPVPLSLFDPEYFARVAPPGTSSIFECSPEQVRKLYQRRFRVFLGVEALARLLARYPCGMVPDDHELIDNFGAAPAHSSPKWQAIREGALAACFDYEGLRFHRRASPRPSMHFSFEYGPVAGFVMDLRSGKWATEERTQIYSEAQHADLEKFLSAHAHLPIVMLALSVPLVHLPDWLAAVGGYLIGEHSDAADRWSFPRAMADRARLVRLLRAHRERHPQQTLLLLGGDVHCGVLSEISFTDELVLGNQLVSSAVSNLESGLYRYISTLLPKLAESSVIGAGEHCCRIRLLEGEGEHRDNPFSGLNVGLVQLERVDGGWRHRLALVSCSTAGPPRPRTVFESRWMPLSTQDR
jgi:alkaline phosphatase D